MTFMFEPAKLQMNWARASGTSTRRISLVGRAAVSALVKVRLLSFQGGTLWHMSVPLFEI
jgi:hypothetical protein